MFRDTLPRKGDVVIAKKYRVLKHIGGGSFGNVYMAVDMVSGESVAVKIESADSKHTKLHYEMNVYQILRGGFGIPNIRYFERNKSHTVLVMDMLGSSIEVLFTFCSQKFSLKTVLMLANEMIKRVEYIHSKGLIHRDVKPENFLMGNGTDYNKLYIIDFGLAKKYLENNGARHILYREDKGITGTARYASIHTHLGIEQSRRDDLESLGYLFVYLNKGFLPWQSVKAATMEQKYEKICEKKISTPLEVLCHGYPQEFYTYLNYCRKLKFEETPDYEYLRYIFWMLFKSLGYQRDYVYDWMLIKRDRHSHRKLTMEMDASH